MKKRETERFFQKLENVFSEGSLTLSEFENMMTEWGQFVFSTCYVSKSKREIFLELNQLQLSIQWFRIHSDVKGEALTLFVHKMERYIQIELESLEFYSELGNCTIDKIEANVREMSWSGNKRSLIELICALNEAKCINAGNTPLQKVLVLFGEFFNVDLANYHSEVNKMATRKPLKDSDQRSYFINDLADRFNQKMLNK